MSCLLGSWDQSVKGQSIWPSPHFGVSDGRRGCVVQEGGGLLWGDDEIWKRGLCKLPFLSHHLPCAGTVLGPGREWGQVVTTPGSLWSLGDDGHSTFLAVVVSKQCGQSEGQASLEPGEGQETPRLSMSPLPLAWQSWVMRGVYGSVFRVFKLFHRVQWTWIVLQCLIGWLKMAVKTKSPWKLGMSLSASESAWCAETWWLTEGGV